MILEANADILGSLRSFYTRLVEDRAFTLGPNCKASVQTFAVHLDEMIYDLRAQIARARLLVTVADDTKNIVLQHLQSQQTENMESLNRSMRHIGAMSQKEALMVRVITVVTLIYLPATFVSVRT
jgi:hypothetical protein